MEIAIATPEILYNEMCPQIYDFTEANPKILRPNIYANEIQFAISLISGKTRNSGAIRQKKVRPWASSLPQDCCRPNPIRSEAVWRQTQFTQ